MKNQTAVEWLIQELNLHGYDFTIQRAKELEKQQIIEAYYIGADEESDHHGAMYKDKDDAEQYYNQTYNL
jgi:hypothetical protein